MARRAFHMIASHGFDERLHIYTVFCPGYIVSRVVVRFYMHLVLFIQFILNSVKVAYICII